MKRYPLVDIFKLLFAVGIVAIHCNLFLGTDAVSWYILHGVLRIGVPFFFCVSGFFLCKSLDRTKDADKNKKVLTYLKRILIPFVVWILLDFYYFYRTRCVGLVGFVLIKYIVKNLIFYPWGAMWYLLALMVSVLILYPFYKKNKLRVIVGLGGILYLVGLLGNNYYFLIEGTKLQYGMEWYINHFLCTRNGIFEGLYFVGIGMLISRVEFKPKLWMLICSYGLFVVEIFLIKGRSYLDDHSLFISFLFFIPILVLYLTKFDEYYDTSKIRNYSSGIYFMHRFVLGYSTLILSHYSIVLSNEIMFLITISITTILLTIGYKSNNRFVLPCIR
ncbi:MAG: acyltransferase [Bacilli bacterium]|nr:acyltransferase [Bacilli bacterium]